jgi:hypothetical protein
MLIISRTIQRLDNGFFGGLSERDPALRKMYWICISVKQNKQLQVHLQWFGTIAKAPS